MANGATVSPLSIDDKRARISALLRQVDAEMKSGNLDNALELTHQVYQYDTKNLYARALEERIIAMKNDRSRPKPQTEPPVQLPPQVASPSPKPTPEITPIREESKPVHTEKPKEVFTRPTISANPSEITLPQQREATLARRDDTRQMEEMEQNVMQKMNSILESKQREMEEEFQRRLQEMRFSSARQQEPDYNHPTSLHQLQINTMPVLMNYQDQQEKELRERLFLERQVAQEEMFRRLEETHKRHEEELARQMTEQHEQELKSEVTKSHQLALNTYRSTLTMLMQFKVVKVVQQAISATMRTTLSISEEEHLDAERSARADAYTQEIRELLSKGPLAPADWGVLSKLQALYSISEGEHKILIKRVKRELGLPDETAVILVVDDDPAILTSTSLLLEETYLNVYKADSIEKAGLLLHQHTPDLILSDVGLPGAGGFTFFENIQQGLYGDTIKSVPFVFMSGMGDQYFIKSAKQLGAKAYLVKPFTKEALEKAVMEALT